MEIIKSLQNRIYEIRGQRVLLDKDLAEIYETYTKVLNQAVKRHLNRFPLDFMFQLTNDEVESINLQEHINDLAPNLRSQIVTSSLEQGVAMLSGSIDDNATLVGMMSN